MLIPQIPSYNKGICVRMFLYWFDYQFVVILRLPRSPKKAAARRLRTTARFRIIVRRLRDVLLVHESLDTHLRSLLKWRIHDFNLRDLAI